MRLLILDCKKFNYRLDHKTPVAEEISDDMTQKDFENPLMIFATVECGDMEKKNSQKIAEDIKKIASKIGVKQIILNPFAHLSNKLAKKDEAITLLDELADELRKSEEFEIERSVFGWYKEFSIDVKAHDSSQIYREY